MRLQWAGENLPLAPAPDTSGQGGGAAAEHGTPAGTGRWEGIQGAGGFPAG